MPGNAPYFLCDFWRVCSGINEKARDRVVEFLSSVLNVDKYPLTVLDRPIESETCKIVENSYRATILAYLHEWSLFAERNGVDLIKVMNAIKVRPTHSNMIFPGPGIGGFGKSGDMTRFSSIKSGSCTQINKRWWEFEKQDTYPAPGHSWARFFRNQENLTELRIQQDLPDTLKGADAVVLAVRHQEYLKLTPDEIVEMAGNPVAIIDCFGILDDEKIKRYFELGCEVKGLGRGHVKRIKDQVRLEKY